MSMGRYSLVSVFDSLLSRDMQLWCAVEDKVIAAAITQINVWPTGLKTASVVLVGGRDMGKWVYMMNDIEEWAAQNGCVLITASGRPGWKRVLGPGWQQKATDLVKDLNHA